MVAAGIGSIRVFGLGRRKAEHDAIDLVKVEITGAGTKSDWLWSQKKWPQVRELVGGYVLLLIVLEL